jgi:hypothetical protein
MRMPRVSVYLPDDLYDEVKRSHMPVSEVLQDALRARAAVQARLDALDGYLADMIAEVGEPTDENMRAADELTRRILAHDLGAAAAGPDDDAQVSRTSRKRGPVNPAADPRARRAS